MKRFSLIALAAATALASQAAFTIKPQRLAPTDITSTDVPEMQASTSKGYEIKFCKSLADWTQVASLKGLNYRAYIHIPGNIATQLAGNKITGVNFSAVIQNKNSEGKYELGGTVFVCEDINADPVTSSPVTVTSSNTSSPQVQTGALETPYEIKEGQEFYFGYTVENCGTKAYPIGLDTAPTTPFGGTVEVTYYGQTVTLTAEELSGTNIYLTAVTEGEKKAINNLAYMRSFAFTTFTTPTVEPGATPKLQMVMTNLGDNKISSIDYALDLNGNTTETQTLTTTVLNGNSSTRTFNLPMPAVEGKNNITFMIKAINGEPIELAKSVVCFGAKTEDTVTRNFLCEEGTGTWCGYCPRGIVGLETMDALYPETFIPIGVHSGDDLQVDSYIPFIQEYVSGFPTCIINRDRLFIKDPAASTLKTAYNTWLSNPAVAKITIDQVEPMEKMLRVTTTSTFNFDDPDAKYAIAFVTREEGLTGSQHNYFTGSTSAPGEWGTYPEYKDWTYEHTARGIYDPFGVDNSVPTSVKKGQPYTFTYDVPLTNVKDMLNSSVVVMLMETVSGTVMNSAQMSASIYGGIDEIATDTNSNAPVEYFNLQGIRVVNPQAGQLLIRRQGNNVSKIIVK